MQQKSVEGLVKVGFHKFNGVYEYLNIKHFRAFLQQIRESTSRSIQVEKSSVRGI